MEVVIAFTVPGTGSLLLEMGGHLISLTYTLATQSFTVSTLAITVRHTPYCVPIAWPVLTCRECVTDIIKQ